MKLFAIVGAGGFGREVLPLATTMLASRHESEDYRIVFVAEGSGPATANGCDIMPIDAFLASPHDKHFNIAIADSTQRHRLADQLGSAGARPFSVVAQNHVDLGHNAIGEGAILCPFTTITSNAVIGRYFHANIYSYVAHDCIIGDFVTFAPNVHCNGGVVIEDHAYIGTGVVIKQATTDRPVVIGRGAVVGMGAVVTRSVAPHTTVIGNPAVILEKKVKQ